MKNETKFVINSELICSKLFEFKNSNIKEFKSFLENMKLVISSEMLDNILNDINNVIMDIDILEFELKDENKPSCNSFKSDKKISSAELKVKIMSAIESNNSGLTINDLSDMCSENPQRIRYCISSLLSERKISVDMTLFKYKYYSHV